MSYLHFEPDLTHSSPAFEPCDIVRVRWEKKSQYAGSEIRVHSPDAEGEIYLVTNRGDGSSNYRVWIPAADVDAVIAALQWIQGTPLARLAIEAQHKDPAT